MTSVATVHQQVRSTYPFELPWLLRDSRSTDLGGTGDGLSGSLLGRFRIRGSFGYIARVCHASWILSAHVPSLHEAHDA